MKTESDIYMQDALLDLKAFWQSFTVIHFRSKRRIMSSFSTVFVIGTVDHDIYSTKISILFVLFFPKEPCFLFLENPERWKRQ